MVLSNPFNKVYQNKEFNNVLKYGKYKFPFIVDIELTNYCNLNCLFCGQQDMKRKRGLISETLFKKVVDECAKHKTPIRFIRWGESFLHPKIADFISYVKSKKLPLHITTNGLAFKNNIELLTEVDSVIFSFQGATKKGYEEMRNNKKYDELEANIKELIKIRQDKPYIHITSTMTNETPKQIASFIRKWKEIVDEVTVGKTNLSAVDVDPKIKKKETIKHIYRPCAEVYQKLSVDWDGRVSCCCSDWDNFMTVGNVKEQTLKSIWNNSEELKAFRTLLDNMQHKSLTMCKNCFHTYHAF